MNTKEIYEELQRNPKDVRFATLCKAAEMFGFKFRAGKGSHQIFAREGIREMLNFQNVKGKASHTRSSSF